jgi:transposase-like protein
LHPSKSTEGVRSDKPDQLWHVDTTVLRLVDGRRVYLRALIDNFSTKVLAWWAGANFDAGANAILLAKAAEAKNRPGGDEKPQSVMVDGGIENFNDVMAKLVGAQLRAPACRPGRPHARRSRLRHGHRGSGPAEGGQGESP